MKLMCYLPTGYPSLERSMEIAELYLRGGCDGIEISLPYPEPVYEPVHIGAAMLYALWQCGDYDTYLERIRQFKASHPQSMTVNLVSGDTIRRIGWENYARFYRDSGMECLLGVGMDEELNRAAIDSGIGLSAAIGFDMPEEQVQFALRLDKGLVYLASKPGKDTVFREGCDTLDKCIRYLKQRGVKLPIYCGVGIRTPEDVARIRRAGAEGVFLGSSFMNHFDDEAALLQTVSALHRAAHGED